MLQPISLTRNASLDRYEFLQPKDSTRWRQLLSRPLVWVLAPLAMILAMHRIEDAYGRLPQLFGEVVFFTITVSAAYFAFRRSARGAMSGYVAGLVEHIDAL